MIEVIKELIKWAGIGTLVLLFMFFWRKIQNGR